MYVALRSIGQKELHLQQICPPVWLEEILEGTSIQLAGKSSLVDVRILRQQALLSVRGTFTLYVHVVCVRCAESIERCLTGKVNACLLPRPASAVRNQEAKNNVLVDDLSLPDCDMYYDAEGFSLTELLTPEILVELPTLPLCSQDCLGLCGSCGQNLNVELCSCSEQQDRLEGSFSYPGC